MSSPNLNVLTLFGSVLTYSSGFLFAVEEPTHSQSGPSTAVLQVTPQSLKASIIPLASSYRVILCSPGPDVDSLRRQYSGVRPDSGEDMETVSSVHPANA